MEPKALAVIGLRAAALALVLTGQSRAGNALYALADAAESGANVDAHMATVADKLKDRTATDADWQDVAGRIEADSARLQQS